MAFTWWGRVCFSTNSRGHSGMAKNTIERQTNQRKTNRPRASRFGCVCCVRGFVWSRKRERKAKSKFSWLASRCVCVFVRRVVVGSFRARHSLFGISFCACCIKLFGKMFRGHIVFERVSPKRFLNVFLTLFIRCVPRFVLCVACCHKNNLAQASLERVVENCCGAKFVGSGCVASG